MRLLAWLRKHRRCRSWYSDKNLGMVRCQHRLDHTDFLHRHVREGGGFRPWHQEVGWPNDLHTGPPPEWL